MMVLFVSFVMSIVVASSSIVAVGVVIAPAIVGVIVATAIRIAPIASTIVAVIRAVTIARRAMGWIGIVPPIRVDLNADPNWLDLSHILLCWRDK